MLPRRQRQLQGVKVLFSVVRVAQCLEAGGIGRLRVREALTNRLRIRRRCVYVMAILYTKQPQKNK